MVGGLVYFLDHSVTGVADAQHRGGECNGRGRTTYKPAAAELCLAGVRRTDIRQSDAGRLLADQPGNFSLGGEQNQIVSKILAIVFITNLLVDAAC